MKLSVATNFDDDLIDKIKEYPVYEVYGKMQRDFIGGGRPSNTLKNIETKKFENHVKKTRSENIKFNYLLKNICKSNYNYLLNGACLNNNEQDEKWQNEFKKFLEYLNNLGVNALTVTNPFLFKIIKKYYNCFDVRVSTFACVDSYEKAKFWEQMGADYICVDFVKINRDFETLKYMVKN